MGQLDLVGIPGMQPRGTGSCTQIHLVASPWLLTSLVCDLLTSWPPPVTWAEELQLQLWSCTRGKGPGGRGTGCCLEEDAASCQLPLWVAGLYIPPGTQLLQASLGYAK